ncbi:MAG TPA: hypothetical protein PKD00_01600 [Burkholderiales bacterium]|nr:hypothetical protein [Burkholderiales bacterium]
MLNLADISPFFVEHSTVFLTKDELLNIVKENDANNEDTNLLIDTNEYYYLNGFIRKFSSVSLSTIKDIYNIKPGSVYFAKIVSDTVMFEEEILNIDETVRGFNIPVLVLITADYYAAIFSLA